MWEVAMPPVLMNLRSLTGKCVSYNTHDSNNKLIQANCDPGITPWTLDPDIGSGDHLSLPHPNLVPVRNIQYFLIRMVGDNNCIDDDGWSHAVGQVMIHTKCNHDGFNDNTLWGIY
jgi:hypothetical protein